MNSGLCGLFCAQNLVVWYKNRTLMTLKEMINTVF